jgi:hypothetical protein
MPRSRPIYCVAILVVIALGLLSRRFPQFLPAALGEYPGDAMWASMIFLGFGFWLRRSTTLNVALAALTFCIVIEAAQLYHAPWIESVRATSAGHLVLGRGFAWNDIVAYSVGIQCGITAEFAWQHWTKNKKADLA